MDLPPSEGSSKLLAFPCLSTEDTDRLLTRVNSGSPLDPCPLKMVKACREVIIPHLTVALNAAISEGQYPSSWKVAEVKPLLKKPSLDPGELKNYRPISLLPVPAKILESHLNVYLYSYLQDHHLLDDSQHDFRSLHSTESALTVVFNKIRSQVDAGHTTALILLDLTAAFDTLSPSRLIERLEEIGIGGSALGLLASFLTARTQMVTLGPFRSEPSTVVCGVPQGSSLSPTLFNIYVAPLAKVVRSFGLEVLSYADDTQILVSVTQDSSDPASNFRACMEAVSLWMSSNFLKLNGEKTEVLVFSSKPELWSSEWWPASLGTCPCPVPYGKNLGVIVDNLLAMNRQVSRTISTCFGIIRTLRKISHHLSVESRKQVVTALVISRLDYCNALYLGINKGLIQRLQLVQNAEARLVMDLPKFHSISATLRALHWLPVEKRILFKTLCLAHKAFFGSGPEAIKAMLPQYTPPRLLRSLDKNLLVVPRVNKARWGGRAFSTLASKLWNSLPGTLSGSQHTSRSAEL